jgi:hypothetical protein
LKFTSLILLSIAILFSINLLQAQLSVQTLGVGSKPGFIDNPVMVVEPHGAFVEQSLYLNYSDHNAYPGNKNVEIVHRFTLPPKAVINDMWLWIGDSVMKALVLDTWTARHIYDSIVSTKRDPAFLAKSGDMYELHIYPLVSGSFRKIKLNFIVPATWSGSDGTADLPIRLLADNNATVKPLRILFRERQDVWGNPSILEKALDVFSVYKDTMGFSYQALDLSNVSDLSSLSLRFKTSFAGGYFLTSSQIPNEETQFQFGFVPGRLFNLPIDSSFKRILFGIDLSGGHNKNPAILIPNLKQLIKSTAKPTDSIKILVAGAGKTQLTAQRWIPAVPDSIDAMLDQFLVSDYGSQVFRVFQPYVLFAGEYCLSNWGFSTLAELATYAQTSNLESALLASGQADIIANFRSRPTGSSIAMADTFFQKGGRLLTYVDNNWQSPPQSSIAATYIDGLDVISWSGFSPTLYRNPSGNIGMSFPETFVHPGFDYVFHLSYGPNSGAKVDVTEAGGKAVVISKKVRNGLLVVSGIYSQKDDDATRKMIAVPLLGLNDAGQSSYQQVTGTLSELGKLCRTATYDKIVLLSNSDTLFDKSGAETIASGFASSFSGTKPQFSSINLLDGGLITPPAITVQSVTYYGSGYLMKVIADAMQGTHFETHLDTWTTIRQTLSPFSYPVADFLHVTAIIDNGAGTLRELREVDPQPHDPNKARFFIGSSSPALQLGMRVQAQFHSIPGTADTSFSILLDRSSSLKDTLLPAMLGNLKIQDLFNAGGKDTAAIVRLALQYHLLTNYTALLALEPNDTIHFMKNPFDESGLTAVNGIPPEIVKDSLALFTYPNPFNSQTNIVVKTKSPSIVTISIYNILGQLVATIAENETIQDIKTYSWHGTNNSNESLSSGPYFIQIVARELGSNLVQTRMRKILMLK